MKKRYTMENPALAIVALVFSFIGTIFLILGIVLGFSLEDAADAKIFLLVYSLIGAAMLTAGIICFCILRKKKKQKRFLLERGHYIMAEIIGVNPNYSVQVNGRCGWEVLCQYRGYDAVHVFKSRMLFFDPTKMLQGDRVKVYVDGDDYDHYYVDLDSVLPQIKLH